MTIHTPLAGESNHGVVILIIIIIIIFFILFFFSIIYFSVNPTCEDKVTYGKLTIASSAKNLTKILQKSFNQLGPRTSLSLGPPPSMRCSVECRSERAEL